MLEPLGGYLLLGAVMGTDPDRYGGPWNFGPDSSSTVTVGELTGLVVDAWGSGSWESTATGRETHEAGLLALDISKARYTLGWRPSLTIADAVAMTVEWYAACVKGAGAAPICEKQIRAYMERMSHS